MKSIVSIITLLLVMHTSQNLAQTWELLNPKPTYHTFPDVDFINDSTGCMVTYEGEVFRTSNSGATFEKVFNDDTYTFQSIDFVDDLKGFVAGQSGYEGNFIGKTTDGGKTWTQLSDPGGYTYFDVTFVDDIHGWICGWYNTIIRTTDGGETWTKLSGNVWSDNLFNTCDFINADTGFIGGSWGYYPHVAVLYKTYDGGVTLQPVVLPALSEQIVDIKMLSNNEIWLAEGHQVQGHTRLYHSVDGGSTWQNIDIGFSTDPCQKFTFIDPLKSRVIGGSSCFTTEDGWLTWNHYYFNCEDAIFTGDWVSESTAYIVGQDGVIAKTTSAGSSWNQLSTGIRASLCDIEFYDNQNGCVVGSYGDRACFAYTDDGGNTWDLGQYPPSDYAWVLDVMYTSESELWAVGPYDRIYHSTDKGQTWDFRQISNFNVGFYSLCNLGNGKLLSGGSELYGSNDNGSTWQKNNFSCPGYNIRKIIFPDSENGYMTLMDNSSFPNYGRMFKTTDGGLTWTGIPFINNDSLKIISISFINKDIGLINIDDQRIFKTIDGGLSWIQCNYSGINYNVYLKMFDENNVVASSTSPAVMYSFDGGINWTVDKSPDDKKLIPTSKDTVNNKGVLKPTGISGVFGRYFSEMGIGWRCGDGGIIEKYSDLFVDISNPLPNNSLTFNPFPNPTTGKITFPNNNIPDHILIYNLNSECIYRNNSPTSRLDLSSLASGPYIMVTFKGRHQQAIKIIKE